MPSLHLSISNDCCVLVASILQECFEAGSNYCYLKSIGDFLASGSRKRVADKAKPFNETHNYHRLPSDGPTFPMLYLSEV